MNRLTSSLFALFASAVPLHAGEVTNFTLDNGLEVVVIEDHRAPVVVNMVWYRAGSADEPPGRSGIAHFLEHLLFKGTDDMEPGELSRVVADNGGTDNAFTSYDYTAYFQRVASDRLELMMRMEADRMRDLILSEEDIATERDVIIEERAMRTDSDPGALMGEQMRATLYMNHPYGVPVIGWRHEMETLERADALAYYTRFYAPNNAMLAIAGDVDPQEVKTFAQTYFGQLEPTPDLAPRERPKEPVPLIERRVSMQDARVSQPYLIRTYIAPERNPGDQAEAAALTYLAEILGGSAATSVLGRALQFDTNTAVYASANYSGDTVDIWTFSFVLVPAADVTLEEGEAALDAEIAKFMEKGIDVEQFERIKFQIRASETYALDSVRAQANRYGQGWAIGLDIEDVKAWPQALQEVTPQDVMEVAKKVLRPTHSVTGYLMPEQEVAQ
ncbi:MAG: M16 family metallopeptidase [Maritimibacter sp.]